MNDVIVFAAEALQNQACPARKAAPKMGTSGPEPYN